MQDFLVQYYNWIIFLVGVWVLPWKGMALWKAAHRNEKIWFIILLIVNTVGLLEIFYIFVWIKFLAKEESAWQRFWHKVFPKKS